MSNELQRYRQAIAFMERNQKEAEGKLKQIETKTVELDAKLTSAQDRLDKLEKE